VRDYGILLLFAVLGAVYVGGAILAARLLAPKGSEGRRKHQPYECGIEPTGDARIQFKVGYYMFALVFMVFDVESLFLFPALAAYSDADSAAVDNCLVGVAPWQAVVELLVFVVILFGGLFFAWRKKVLEWQ